MASGDIRSIVDWLVDGARSTMQAHQVLAELCDRLVSCGIPLWRVAVFVRTLHPHIMARRFVWRPGADVEIRDAPFELLETAEFRVVLSLRFPPAGCLFAGALPTLIVPSILHCSRSLGTKACRII